MGSPTDIPGVDPSGGSSGGGSAPEPDDGGIRNPNVRAAIEAATADPGPAGTIEVLRNCLFGFLLLDVTGSDLDITESGELAAGSTVNIRGGEGPDGKPAIFAFTSHEQLAAMYADDAEAQGIEIQSLVQQAVGALELVGHNEAAWLCLDPAGPTVALSAEDLEFALRVPRNDAVRAALEPDATREQLLDALRSDGLLNLAVIAPELETGVEEQTAEVQVRTTDSPDGNGQALVAFTSGPEVLSRAPEDRIATQNSADVLELVREAGFGGLVVNPAGPWAFVPADELA